MKWVRSVVAALALAPSLVFGGPGSADFKERMVRDLDFIQNVFETKYAPSKWKKDFSGWDLDTEIARAKEEVLAGDGKSIKAYQRILLRLLNSTMDYHVSIRFFSTEAARLPFHVSGVEGKYYITYIDRDRLPVRSFPFNVGDELVLFDGKPTVDIVQELKDNDVGDASPGTDQALAEIYLTNRDGRHGHIVPRGPVSVAVKSTKTGQVSSYQIIWDYTPERIKDPSIRSLSRRDGARSDGLLDHPIFRRQMVSPRIANLLHSPKAGSPLRHPNELGARESFVPALGDKLWESDASYPFHAYIFEHPDNHQLIGYVRIPTYQSGEDESETRENADCFAHVISHLERQTDALVIDQVNNPGGSVFYLYCLASMLTEQPLYTPRHRMTLTQADIAYALESLSDFEEIDSDDHARFVLGETIGSYPVTYQFSQFLVNFFRFIIDEWNDGRTLTTPYYLYGVDFINPHPEVRYTKPIVVLINSLDFSGGDFLPAILQDNKRVTLFGSRTAGAGGYVDNIEYPNLFGVEGIHYTSSIAERIDRNPIENLGVLPDVPYELTKEDMQTGYSSYVRKVLETVDDVLPK